MVVKKKKPNAMPVKVATETKTFGNVRPCNCAHDFQDAYYGKGMRLHTTGKGGSPGHITYRCTVCGTKKG
jgi:hypothetical protein